MTAVFVVTAGLILGVWVVEIAAMARFYIRFQKETS